MHLAMRPTPCTIGQVYLLVFLLYKAEMTSVRPSVCLSDRHADSSVVYVWIDVGLGQCRAVVSGM